MTDDAPGKGLGIAETVDVAQSPAPADKPPSKPSKPPSGKPASAGGAAADALAELPLVEPDNYEILGLHGRGGLGRILRARDRRTGRVVAIKEIIHDTPSVIARFQREALVTANLQHPAIVPVYEVGRWPNGKPFYTMKLVLGRTLADAIDLAGANLTGRLALLPHAVQVAYALAYAHDQGWIHRDLKPANVLVGDFGETVVIDWGLARRWRGASALASLDPDGTPARVMTSKPPSLDLPPSGATDDTQAGTVVGTPVYMAPEQARGETIDARADVYAIGALLYHILGGAAPYRERKTADAVIEAVAAGPPRALTDLAPELPQDLIAIVERAMARDADERYPTAAELAIDLGRYQSGVLVEAHRYTLGERLAKFVRKHKGAVAVAVIAAVAVAAISTIAIRNVIHARDVAEAERGRAEAARAQVERESTEARKSLAALHRELGRNALADGAPGRALPHLARALRSMTDDDAGVMRVATGLAVDALRGARGAIETGETVFAIQIEGARVLPSTMAGAQQVWNLDDGTTTTFDGVHGRLARDGTFVATRSADFRSVTVRRADHGAEVATLSGDGLVYLDGFAGDNRLWIGFDRGAVERWRIGDAATPDGKVALPAALHRIHVGGTGRWGIAAGSRGEVWRFDLDHGAVTVLDPGGAGRPDVEAVRVLGDDGRLAAFAADGTLRLWSVDGGAPRTIRDARATGGPAVTRDGRFVAVWSSGARVRVVDVAAATIGPAFGDPSPSETVVAISSDGRLVATGDADGGVAVWRVADGTRIATAPGHAEAVTAIAFAPDDRTVISAAVSGDVRAWRYDESTRDLFVHHDRAVLDARFIGSDRVVTVDGAGLGRITRFDGTEIATLPHPTDVLGFDENGGLIATCGGDGVARLWRPDGAPGAMLGKPGGSGCTVAMAPAGARLAVAHDTTVAIYRLDGTHERDLEVGGLVERLAWSGDGARVFVVHPDLVTLWDAATGSKLATIEPRGAPSEVVVSQDVALAAIRTDGHEVDVVSTRTGESAFVALLDQRVAALDWGPGGLLMIATRGGRVDLYDRTGKRQPSIRLGIDAPTVVRGRPDNALIAVGGELGEVELWDRATGKLLVRRDIGAEIAALRWSDDGHHLAVVPARGDALIWDLSPYADTLDALDRLIRCRAPFALDGDRLVAATPPPDCHAAKFTD